MGLVELARDEFSIPIVLVSHQIDEVMRLAAQVVMLERGRVTEIGAPEEIFASARPENPSERFGLGSAIACDAGDYDDHYGLTRLKHPAGEVFLPGRAASTGKTRVFIKAVDVALARKPPPDMSIRTLLAGRVFRIAASSGPLALATIELTGGERLYASLTRMAADQLGLAPGEEVFAMVKAVALDEREIESN
jgi:molybdate transport system ATP-binding protein